MSVGERGVRVWKAINFSFVSWGVLYVLGMIQPLIRALFGTQAGSIIILALVILLQAAALLCAGAGVYRFIIYLSVRIAAVRRANRRIEALRVRGETITKDIRDSIRREEFARGQREPKTIAQHLLPYSIYV